MKQVKLKKKNKKQYLPLTHWNLLTFFFQKLALWVDKQLANKLNLIK